MDTLTHMELQKRYQVPFFLWANYDIVEENYGTISVNYLSTLLLSLTVSPHYTNETAATHVSYHRKNNYTV